MSNPTSHWQDWLERFLRLALGGIYVAAGALKVGDPGKFAEAVDNFRLVPHELINLVAMTLPWVEIVAGLFLIFGVWVIASGWLINLLTTAFIGGIAQAVYRGLNIECGCFGTMGGRRVGLTAIAEDVLMLAAGLWIVWHAGKRLAAPGPPTLVETPSTTP